MAAINIGRSSSYCMACNKSASPEDDGHTTIYGYDMNENGKPGCREPWTKVVINYYPPVGYVYENLRGLPMEGFGIGENATYPPEGD